MSHEVFIRLILQNLTIICCQ